jgi:hypothetical protein
MQAQSSLSPLGVKQSTLVAAAGEYYVLARLSLLGKIAAQAPRGVPNADIVVSSVEGDRLCAVQVKARQGKGGDGGWHMSKKHEGIGAPQLFYAFVDFGDLLDPRPQTYILPRFAGCDDLCSGARVSFGAVAAVVWRSFCSVSLRASVVSHY